MSHSARGTLGREVPKILRARDKGKKGPFIVSGGVRIVAYGKWLLVMNQNHRPADIVDQVSMTPWTRDQFEGLIEKSLESGLLQHAPFWVSFDLDQKHRNVLVASGVDPLWTNLTKQCASPVMHAQKLLQRWKDPQQVLWLCPLWPTSH